MKKRIILSSMQTVAQLLKQNEALFQVEAFLPLKPALARLFDETAGGCTGCQRAKILNEYRTVFDSALTSLQQADKDKIKAILNVEEVCYYVKNENGAFVLNCA